MESNPYSCNTVYNSILGGLCITAAGLVMFYFVCRVALAFIPSEWKYRKYKELRETMEEWRRRYEEENN